MPCQLRKYWPGVNRTTFIRERATNVAINCTKQNMQIADYFKCVINMSVLNTQLNTTGAPVYN